MKRTIKDYLLITLRGIGMGAADVVPGVSGGTIAFITGIYEELINSIKSINLSAFKTLFKKGIASFWKAVNANFLLALLIGILISVVSLAKILKELLQTHPILIWSFFFGLIVASAIYVARKITAWSFGTVIAIILGAVTAFIITEITPAETTNAYWFVFVSGALAICAMILPGISGSFILLLLGKYEFILGAVSEFKVMVIAVFGVGAVVGLLSFSNLLSWLLKRFHNITVAVLSGFMIGSLNKVWPWKQNISYFTDSHGVMKPLVQKNILPASYTEITGESSQLGLAILMAVIGFVLIVLMEWLLTGTKDKKHPVEKSSE